MQLIPVIIEYPDTPFAVTHIHRIAAGRMVQDVSRVFNRIVKRAMAFTTETVHLHCPNPMDPLIKNAAVRSSSDGWWDAWGELVRAGRNPNADVYCVWHANQWRDVSGIGQPAGEHVFEGEVHTVGGAPDRGDPTVGGIATNGFGQIVNGVTAGWEDEIYRANVLYAAHEVGHALGRHHTPHPSTGLSDPYYNAMRSIMGYGYSAIASGRKVDGQYPNPMLATPDEIVWWRQHAVFGDIPERWDATRPGWADDLILVRADDQRKLLEELDTGGGRGRLLVGSMAMEYGDPIE